MPVLKISKRWTFIIDPDIIIASTDKNVDPVHDAERFAIKLEKLQGGD